MGWNSWYDLQGDLDEKSVRATADALISTGLAKLGYIYVNLDDCWAAGRYPNGSVYAEAAKFPSQSLKPLADYVHSLGLKFGTYTDRGTKTCAGRPGSQDYEAIDAQTYASWGIDYVKEDSCYASDDHNLAFTQYGKMRDGLNATGRPIFFSLCGWNEWYAPVGMGLGNSWRIGPDDTDWPGVLKNININARLAQYSGPGGWNDPCLLLAETSTGELRMTHTQTRTQFNFWAIMASPLLISANVRNMSQENLETYMNTEVIAIDQDRLGLQGIRLVGGDLSPGSMQGLITLQDCNPRDLNQIWTWNSPASQYLFNNASNLCINVDNCGYDLISFTCVTTGGTCCGANCYDNMKFSVTSDHHLVSPTHPGLCAQGSSDGSVSLTACIPNAESQYWSLDGSGMLQLGSKGTQCAAVQAGGTNVWGRQIVGGWAVLFVNTGSLPADVECDDRCFRLMGFAPNTPLDARDVWKHSNFPASSSGFVASQVEANGGSMLLVFRDSP